MKKFINITFAAGLVVWFVTAVYLSVNSIIGIFTDVNPTVSKMILAGSFIWTAGFGLYNKYSGGSLTQIGVDLQATKEENIKKTGCKTCGQNKIKVS